MRKVSREIGGLMTERFPGKGADLLEKARKVFPESGWRMEEKTYPVSCRVETMDSFRLLWLQKLPPVFPFSTWPSFFRYFFPCIVSSWSLKRFGQESKPFFKGKKDPVWKIMAKLKLQYVDINEEDIVAIGLTTDPKTRFVGMHPESIGYHCDDGLVCFDSCILRRVRTTREFETITLELDYLKGIVRFYHDDQEIYWNYLHGILLYKPLYIMVTGCIHRSCVFDIEIIL